MKLLENMALISATTIQVAKLGLAFIENEEDRKKAELYVFMLEKGMEKMQAEMAEAMAAVNDVSLINMDELFQKGYDEVVAELRGQG